jgi:hypothetical protein
MFGNRVQREMVRGEWRRLHNEELHDFYSSPNIIQVTTSRIMKQMGHVACIGERRGEYRVLVRQPEGERPLGRPRQRWEAHIKMDLHEMERRHGLY